MRLRKCGFVRYVPLSKSNEIMYSRNPLLCADFKGWMPIACQRYMWHPHPLHMAIGFDIVFTWNEEFIMLTKVEEYPTLKSCVVN